MKTILVPDQYYNCPICGKACSSSKDTGYNSSLGKSGRYMLFFCFNPLVTDPLHYYNHIVDESIPNQIALQEFSLDLGNKTVLVCNNYQSEKTFIRTSKEASPLEVSMIIVPDFPELNSLKKKIRTSLVFS